MTIVCQYVNIVKNAYENRIKRGKKYRMSIVSNIVNIVKNAYASLVYMHVVHS